MQRAQPLAQQRFPALLSAAIAIAALAGLVFWLDPWLTLEFELLTLALNTGPVAIVFALLVAICRRIWPAALLTGLLLGLLFHINAVKLEELHQPLLLSDALLLPQVVGNMALFARYGLSVLLIMGLALAIAALALAFKLERPKFGLIGSIAMAVPALALLALLRTPAVSAVFANQGGLDTPWSPIKSVESSGLIAALAASMNAKLRVIPERQSQQANQLREILGITASPESDSQDRPDVVIILSESFFDPGIIEGVDQCETLPRWCQLTANSLSGSMLVPTYGGNTTRTEYEVLTGVPYSVLPDGVYPYTSIVTRQTASLASWLRSLGYRTSAIHPHTGSFWQRNIAFPLMGFDTFISEENFGPHQRAGYYISDKDLTDRIAKKLGDDSDAPQFIFAISMENHGPWADQRPYVDTDRLTRMPAPSQLSEPAAFTWRQYIYHARNSMRELERLQALIEQRDKPTLVIFFGDHLPSLPQVFNEIEFSNGEDAHTQAVPYLALSNFQMTATAWMPERSYQLANWTLALANLPKPRALEDLSAAYEHIANEGEFQPNIHNKIEALYLEALYENPTDWDAH